MNRIFRIVVSLVMLIGMVVPAACSTNTQSDDQGIVIDSPAPDFSLKDLTGRTVSLSGLKGKVVLINIWTTTCPPCVQELPHFQSLHNDWANRSDVILLTVNLGESQSTVENFMRSNRYTFPVLLDSQFTVAEKYRIRFTPTSLIIDSTGLLKANIIGAFKDKTAIEKQMSEFFPR
jgi:peroxiredoxin